MTCEACSKVPTAAGKGIVITGDDDLFAIDLDNAVDEFGDLRDWAREIVLERFNDTYSEYSLSGKGIHIFGFANKLAFGDLFGRYEIDKASGQRIEVYAKSCQYIIVTEHSFHLDQQRAVVKCQNALDWLVNRYSLRSNAAIPQGDIPGWCENVAIGKRISAGYRMAADFEPSIDGSGGSNVTFKFACRIVRGLCVTDQTQAMGILRVYNERCVGPWSERELEHKYRQALTACREMDWGGCYGECGLLDDLVRIEVKPEPVALPAVRTNMPSWNTGVLGDLINHSRRNAVFFHEEIAMLTAMGIICAFAGRKFTDPTETQLRLYACALCASSGGKNTTFTPLVNALSVGKLAGYVFKGKPGSKQGLLRELEAQPSMTMIVDEASWLIEGFNNTRDVVRQDVMNEVLELFSCGVQHRSASYADKTKNIILSYPCFSMIGVCTRHGFWDAITEENIIKGLVGRMIIFEVKNPYCDLNTAREPCDLPGRVSAVLEYWRDLPTEPAERQRIITYKPEAESRIKGYSTAVRDKHRAEGEVKAAVWGRAGENARKIAMILALSEEVKNPVITLDMVEWAIEFVNAAQRTVATQLQEIGKTDYSRNYERVKEAIRAHGTITRTKLRHSHCRNLDPRLLNDIIKEMETCGLICTAYGEKVRNGKQLATYTWLGE